jgi:hypothetical protein
MERQRESEKKKDRPLSSPLHSSLPWLSFFSYPVSSISRSFSRSKFSKVFFKHYIWTSAVTCDSSKGSFHPNSNFFVAEKNRNWWFFYSVFVMHRWCTLWNLRFLIQTGSCEIGIKVSGFALNLDAEIEVLLVFRPFLLTALKNKMHGKIGNNSGFPNLHSKIKLCFIKLP